ncbi:hypothetical protein FDP41_006634 [Naegleria fowleri]|uniref:F-box domain-containing protein n=1 Tax=Naegleria fowleri TaxID=5763 RepID=A0A6A5BID2_NAEFO|nr:uncharacterized protein FDP41_006634 [Naegleria fowleri]KAF0974602.1 hypothetical protein FDP41_006634 [Naegleria fowleri]
MPYGQQQQQPITEIVNHHHHSSVLIPDMRTTTQQQNPLRTLYEYGGQNDHNDLLVVIFSFLDRWSLIHMVAMTCKKFYKCVHYGGSCYGPKGCFNNYCKMEKKRIDDILGGVKFGNTYDSELTYIKNCLEMQFQSPYTVWRNSWHLTGKESQLFRKKKLISSNMAHYDSRVNYLHVKCDIIDEDNNQGYSFDRVLTEMLCMFLRSNKRGIKVLELESHNLSSISKGLESHSIMYRLLAKLFTNHENGIDLLESLESLVINAPLNIPFTKTVLSFLKQACKKNSFIALKHLDLNIGNLSSHISMMEILNYCKHLFHFTTTSTNSSCRNELVSGKRVNMLESFKCSVPFSHIEEVQFFIYMIKNSDWHVNHKLKELVLSLNMSKLLDSCTSLENLNKLMKKLLRVLERLRSVKRLKFYLIDIGRLDCLSWLVTSTFVDKLELELIEVSPFIKGSELLDSSLTKCKSLHLTLSDCSVSSTTQWAKRYISFPMHVFKYLQELHVKGIDNSKLSTILPIVNWTPMMHLRKLRIEKMEMVCDSFSKLNDYGAIFPLLEDVELMNCIVASSSNLFSLFGTNLKSISAKKCSVAQIPMLTRFVKLQALRFEECSSLTNFDCKSIENLQFLAVLSFACTSLKIVENLYILESLENLVRIDFNGCRHFDLYSEQRNSTPCDLSSLNISRLQKLEFLNMDNVLIMNFVNFSSLHESWAKQIHKMWFEISTKLTTPIQLDKVCIDDSSIRQTNALKSIFQVSSNETKVSSQFSPPLSLSLKSSNTTTTDPDLQLCANVCLNYLKRKCEFMELVHNYIHSRKLNSNMNDSFTNEEPIGKLTVDYVFNTQQIVHIMYSFHFGMYTQAAEWMGSIKCLNHKNLTFWNALDRNISSDKKTRQSFLFSMPIRSKDILEDNKLATSNRPSHDHEMQKYSGFGSSSNGDSANVPSECLVM